METATMMTENPFCDFLFPSADDEGLRNQFIESFITHLISPNK
jgi:hypothetical protein